MAERGGQPGNQNAANKKRWQQAIDRALAKRSKVDAIAELDRLAEIFLASVERGDANFVPGYRELADRMDGKAPQSVDLEMSGNVTVEILRYTEAPIEP